MVMIDTSAWIEYFHNSKHPVVEQVDKCLSSDLVLIGDLVYCEIMQGLRNQNDRNSVRELLQTLPAVEMVGFSIADRAAHNYRLLRSRGVTIRKTIDVIIGTFCAVHEFEIIHNDVDFDRMASVVGFTVYGRHPS